MLQSQRLAPPSCWEGQLSGLHETLGFVGCHDIPYTFIYKNPHSFWIPWISIASNPLPSLTVQYSHPMRLECMGVSTMPCKDCVGVSWEHGEGVLCGHNQAVTPAKTISSSFHGQDEMVQQGGGATWPFCVHGCHCLQVACFPHNMVIYRNLFFLLLTLQGMTPGAGRRGI